ncbi:MAG: L-serine ammonia-lyase [Chloroflexota bacterium]
MQISVFDLFKIGIGPSSSHTVGPMKAARLFVVDLLDRGLLPQVGRIKVTLYGSLGATGKGHGTDKAIILGLEGEQPDLVAIDAVPGCLENIRKTNHLCLLGQHTISFTEITDLKFVRQVLPFHPNGILFTAFDPSGVELHTGTYYSVGGGFVVFEGDIGSEQPEVTRTPLPHPFNSSDELLDMCIKHRLSISQLMLANEQVLRTKPEVEAGLWRIWQVMLGSIQRGCVSEGTLPGGLKVKRRAPQLFQRLLSETDTGQPDPLKVLDWVNLYAMAVNEENASGGQVVTAPTNGAAGIIPAVLNYWIKFGIPDDEAVQRDVVIRFLLTAGAIGMLYKKNASLSGAELGCQGEVGVACSMAAGALAEVRGGTLMQVENAAEIGMEHNLGLTCDPVGGLVQIPCIERNAMGAIKAINAVRIALRGDGEHYVSLDNVIKTMRETGRDMKTKYKETSRGGLAVNVIEC